MRCSLSSRTSTRNTSGRFSPMVNSRRAKHFEVVASFPKLAVDSATTTSIAFAGAPAPDKKADERADTQGDGHGLIGMLMHGFVSRFRGLDRLVTDTSRDFLGALQRGGETFAGFPDLFSSHIGGGGHQCLRVFGQLAHVTTACMCLFVHFVSFVLLVNLFPAPLPGKPGPVPAALFLSYD